ncbi:MAG: hypothetical protein GX190_03850 [Mollicutes bacterium]|nr:hypothetical protein [Mollicutes bacterium]
MNQKIKNILKKLEGEILVIGFDYIEFEEVIQNNDKIIYCDFLNSEDKNTGEGSFGKTINIKKLRSKYKKKKFDYILVNVTEVKEYLKYFIKDSIYLCKNKIYVFNSNEKVKHMYQRYNVDIKLKKDNYLDIDVRKASSNILFDSIYFIYDSLINLLDKIDDVLTR